MLIGGVLIYGLNEFKSGKKELQVAIVSGKVSLTPIREVKIPSTSYIPTTVSLKDENDEIVCFLIGKKAEAMRSIKDREVTVSGRLKPEIVYKGKSVKTIEVSEIEEIEK